MLHKMIRLSCSLLALALMPFFCFSTQAQAVTPAATDAILAFGHKNPDTDSVAGAMAIAELYRAMGRQAKAVAQGPMPPETKFVLQKFDLPTPEIVKSVTGKKVALVDFSDLKQGPDDLAAAEIVGIYDHHKLGDVTTAKPLEMWVWPVGSSNTVLKGVFDHYGVTVPKPLAGAMLAAILSDTVMFKSPTTTEIDKKAAGQLATLAGVTDMQALGLEMFKAKSDFEKASMRDLLKRDAKEFSMGGKKILVAQLEAVDNSLFDPIKDKLLAEMRVAQKEGYDVVLMMLTDIMKGGTLLAVAATQQAEVEKALNVKFDKGFVWVDGMMSRKKQIIPHLEKAYK